MTAESSPRSNQGQPMNYFNPAQRGAGRVSLPPRPPMMPARPGLVLMPIQQQQLPPGYDQIFYFFCEFKTEIDFEHEFFLDF